MSKKLGCLIGEEEKKILDRLTKKLNKSQGEVVSELIKNYVDLTKPDSVISLKSFNLSSAEQQEVENAMTNSNSSLDIIAKDGLSSAIALLKQHSQQASSI